MNRAQRRQSQFKRGQQWNRNDVMAHPAAALNRMRLIDSGHVIRPACFENPA
jgi:hypothetical protein